MISLGFFESDKLIYNQFVINKQFSKWFISNVVPLIEGSQINDNSLEDLKRKLERQVELGEKAEKFVLNYEKIKNK